jgi:hypothetical protein
MWEWLECGRHNSNAANRLFDEFGRTRLEKSWPLVIVKKDGERGRNRTFNLLIKSQNSWLIETCRI